VFLERRVAPRFGSWVDFILLDGYDLSRKTKLNNPIHAKRNKNTTSDYRHSNTSARLYYWSTIYAYFIVVLIWSDCY